MRQTPKVLEVQERARGPLYPARLDGVRISPAAWVAKNVCLSVCLTVTLLNVRVSAHDIAIKSLDYVYRYIGEGL